MSYCIACGNKDKSASYIRFPSKGRIRKQWLKFCKRREEDMCISHRLCTDHFKPEDLTKHFRRTLVRPEAVPCIYLLRAHVYVQSTENDQICSTGIASSDSTTDINIAVYSQSTTAIDSVASETDVLCASSNLIKSTTCSTSTESQDLAEDDADGINVDYTYSGTIEGNYETPVKCQTPLMRQNVHSSAKRKHLDFQTESVDESIHSNIPDNELQVRTPTSAICQSPPQMIPDPRYVGDIRSPHLATPKRAKRAMVVVRRTVTQQKHKIEALQKQLSRYKKRISSLKDLVSELKKKR